MGLIRQKSDEGKRNRNIHVALVFAGEPAHRGGEIVMFRGTRSPTWQSAESWTAAKVDPKKQKLFKMHHFFLMSGGRNYNIEVQEDGKGSFAAYADNTADPHDAMPPCHGTSLAECLNAMVQEIGKRATE